MKKLTGKHVRTGIAGILLAAAVICYSVGIGRGADVRVLEPQVRALEAGAAVSEVMEAENAPEMQVNAELKSSEEEVSHIFIHVCGEVEHPGVYKLPEGSRACDAVEAAGGLTEAAAEDYFNLAQVLLDGQQLRIPDREETEAFTEAGGTAAKVNLNTASKEQLMTLTGIGEARAEAILAYRRDAGPFLVIEDIMKVSGIKEAAFQKIKDDITV